MKAYLVVTGSIFGLAGITHLLGFARELWGEGAQHVFGSPRFVVTSLVIVAIGVGVGVWAAMLFRQALRKPGL